jgi:hypothetical protein
MGMNQSQIKHALARATALKVIKLKALKASFDAKVVNLSVEEKLKARKAGKFSVAKACAGTWRSGIDEYIIFDADVKFDYPSFNKASDKIEAAYSALIDELVLGDQEHALHLLRAFEAS